MPMTIPLHCVIFLLTPLFPMALANLLTRDNNILDIFATNRPSFIADWKVIPGISDHKVV